MARKYEVGHWSAPQAEALALEFLRRVWGERDLGAIDELMTEDYVITSGGQEIRGRDAFKAWVQRFQEQLLDARTDSQDVFADASGSRVVSRWICSGRHNGLLGVAPTGEPVSFTGIAVWNIRNGRLAECWVERAAWELFQLLSVSGRW
jgi:predicted ester cyclase